MIGARKFRTKQARKREYLRVMLRLGAGALVLMALCALFSYTSHLPELRIQAIHTQTDGALSSNELAAALAIELDGSYFGILPKDSVLFISLADLQTRLLERFPRIASATLKRAGLRELGVSIHERTPQALWCGDVVPPVAAETQTEAHARNEELWGTCYLMDNTGYLYAPAPIFTGNVFPRYYGSLEAADPIGQFFIATEEYSAWQEFYLSLAETGKHPQAILLVDERDIELYLSPGLRILLPRETDPDLTRRRLLATLESDAVDATRKVLYIDLRFTGKAFVRYVDDE